MRLGTPAIGGLLLLALMAFRWGDLQASQREAAAVPSITASLGIGVWAVLVGAVLIVVEGLLAGSARRARRRPFRNVRSV